MDIKKLAQEQIAAVKVMAEDLSRLKGFKLSTIQAGIRMLPEIVKKVEVIGRAQSLSGAQKQELAVELAAILAPAPWWLPDGIYRKLLAFAVDAVVDALKDAFPKK